MDRQPSDLDLDLDFDLDDGDDGIPPDAPRGGGGPSGRRRRGRRVRVWPWILGLVALLAAERAVVLGVISMGEAWIWTFAAFGIVGSAAVIAIGGTAFARLR